MTFEHFQLAVAWGGAFAILALIIVEVCICGWREVSRCGRGFATVFAIAAAIATATAQKPPVPPVVKSMHLRIYNVTAKGFDCAWDYGALTPADFRDGETVRLTAKIAGLDYNLLVGTLPVTVTNYHVNAVLRNLPKDWMRHDVEVTARVNNSLLTASDTHHGDADDLPSINDGGNE